MQEIRCKGTYRGKPCNRLLYRVDRPSRTVINESGATVSISGITAVSMGAIECKCPKCGEMSIIEN
jgi:phage FluMu protein Com